jgi:predicted nucleic acid-binding protein
LEIAFAQQKSLLTRINMPLVKSQKSKSYVITVNVVNQFKFKLKKKFSITATSEILGIDQTTTNAIYLVTHKVPA